MWYNFFGDFMLIDTHCHLGREDYDNLDEVILNMNGIMIASGCEDKTNKEVLSLVEKYDNVYGTLGIHPENINSITDESFELIEKNLNNKKIVAIGEIGLDYHYTKENIDYQKEIFIRQLELAKKYNKPIIVHSRDAIKDTYDILKEYNLKGSIHCFSSSFEMAKEFIKIGYKIGVGGTLTFKNSSKIQEIVKKLDLKDLLLETDSPYLTPEPYRGQKNEPAKIFDIAKYIADLKNITIADLSKITNTNIKRIFDI